jgi:hypothetical protein
MAGKINFTLNTGIGYNWLLNKEFQSLGYLKTVSLSLTAVASITYSTAVLHAMSRMVILFGYNFGHVQPI